MTIEDFKRFINHELNLSTRWETVADGQYLIIENYKLPAGPYEGSLVSIAIKNTNTVPFCPHPSVHVSPHLASFKRITKNVNGRNVTARNVLKSKIGVEWQYWSRRFINQPATPQDLWTQLLYTFIEDIN
ncbi:E2/UBC family protein [Haloplasma contractile]|uniref:E2 domain containing protein n=1 Tax=Haloplasma contractile SSD-17B TaxID=1033810 RepID=F7Q1Q0_9MOLU|nr:E2/UBC family protein [Haloplasma contractile]ERJ12287.1 E2 domain containing protein [Haloplasma contractile SSD-17B]